MAPTISTVIPSTLSYRAHRLPESRRDFYLTIDSLGIRLSDIEQTAAIGSMAKGGGISTAAVCHAINEQLDMVAAIELEQSKALAARIFGE